MTTLNLPSLPVLAVHKSNGDANAKLWESLSGKKPLLFQPLCFYTQTIQFSLQQTGHLSVKGHLPLP